MRAVFTYDIFISDISPAMSFSVVCKYRTLCVCIGLWRTALACSRLLARRVGKAWGRLFVRVKEPFATGLGGCSPNMDTNPGSGAGRNLFTATQPLDASPNNNTAPQPPTLNTAGAAPLRGAATTPTGTFHHTGRSISPTRPSFRAVMTAISNETRVSKVGLKRQFSQNYPYGAFPDTEQYILHTHGWRSCGHGEPSSRAHALRNRHTHTHA